MKQELENWTKQVSAYLENLNQNLKTNLQSKSLYCGFKIWYSPIIENTEILFIGINPGCGDPCFHENGVKYHKVDDGELNQFTYLDVFYPKEVYKEQYPQGYRLGEQTVELFQLIGLNNTEIEKLFTKSMKTNFYHIATKKQNDIAKCIGKTSMEAFLKQSYLHIEKLIRIVKPKLIICEGELVFQKLNSGHYITHHQKTLEIDSTNSLKAITFAKIDDIPIIAYKRNFSNISEKTQVAQEIKDLNIMDKINLK